MVEWINERYGTNYTEEQLVNVKDFSLLWNIFENVVCNSNCNVDLLDEKLNPIEFDIEIFRYNLEYFKNRYILDGDTNDRFEHLHLRNGDRREFVVSVLLGNDDTPNDIVLALAIIVYRYRNNLFHGLKDFMRINLQEENFINANNVLKSILLHF
jgi:hypothetical protein